MENNCEVDNQPKAFPAKPYYLTEQGYAMYPPPPPYVVQPGVQPLSSPMGDNYVPDHRILGVVAIFFCLPFGLISFFMASSAVDLQMRGGNTGLAQSKARSAKSFAITSIVLGLVLSVACVVTITVLRINLYSFDLYY